jgi:hypothetical protein
MFLSEFPQQVIDSHALVVAEIMSGETPSSDILLELAAETIAVDRLSVLAVRQTRTIKAAHDLWLATHDCFQSSLILWNQLPHDDFLAGHRRLLIRLIQSAQERCEFYSVSDHDRAVYNSQRDHGLPVEADYVETP